VHRRRKTRQAIFNWRIGCCGHVSSILKQVVEGFLAGILVGHPVLRPGADYAGLEIIAKMGLVFDFNPFLDPLPTLVSGNGVVKPASPAASQIGQTGDAVIDPRRFTVNPRIFSAVPAAKAHTFSFLSLYFTPD
jgi:hypothetical protein